MKDHQTSWWGLMWGQQILLMPQQVKDTILVAKGSRVQQKQWFGNGKDQKHGYGPSRRSYSVLVTNKSEDINVQSADTLRGYNVQSEDTVKGAILRKADTAGCSGKKKLGTW